MILNSRIEAAVGRRARTSTSLASFIAVAAFALLTSGAVGAATKAKQPAKTQDPGVRSNSALVIDAGTADVLYARNPDQVAPIASITKLMTALVVLDAGQSLQDTIVVTDADRLASRRAPSRILVGAKLTRGELMHLALMASDNRAACALARNYPGGMDAALRAMNEKARQLGMTRTRFADASGLSSANVSNARDVAKMVVAASQHATIRNYSTDREHAVRIAKHEVEFRNTNYLVTKSDWQIDLQKTGFTNDAGQCLAMKTTIEGRSLVIVLLDSFGKYTRTADARRIKKWLEARAGEHRLVKS